ncbi:MAG: DUF58 domain-containing protein [Halioglobus sp.]
MRFSRLSVVFMVLVCLMGIAQQWSGELGVAWWRYVLALYMVGLLYEAYVVSRFDLGVDLDVPDSLRLGRREELKVAINNNHWRQSEIEYTPNLPENVDGAKVQPCALSVPANDAARFSLWVTATEIGAHAWELLPIRMRGPLGLAWWPRSLALDAILQVVPDHLGQRHAAADNVSMGEEASHAGAGVELHHLRDYVPGDPMRAINWKATARSQRLVTQVFSEEQHLEIMLVLDLGRTSGITVDGMSQFSHYINLASMFGRYAAIAGDSVGLLAVADRTLASLPPMRGVKAMANINAVLRTLGPQPVETDILSAAMQVQKIARNRCLIVFVTDLYGQTLEGDFGRSLLLWGQRHLPLVVGLIGDEVIDLVPRVANSRDDAFESLAASEYLNAIHANASAARRLGAHAVVARPVDLQAQVIAQYQALKAQRRV